MATTIGVCGFECQVANAAGHVVLETGGVATGTFDTSTVAPGGSGVSFKIVAASNFAQYWAPLATAPTTNANVVGRFRILLSSLPSANAILAGWQSSANNLQFGWDLATGQFILEHQGKWASRVFGPVAVVNRWYTIDIKGSYSATPSADWMVDGEAQPNLPSAAFNSVSGTWGRFWVGQRSNTGGTEPAYTAYTAYYDDLAISQTLADYPLTHATVKSYVPSADGSHNTGAAGNFTDASAVNITDASTTAWTFLDELPPTTTDRVEQRLDTTGNLYVETRFNSTTEKATPLYLDALGVWRAATAASAAGQVKLRDNLGTTDSAIVNTTIAVTTDTYWRAHFAARPAALGAWTTAALNDLRARFGFGTDVTPDIWFGGLLVEVGLLPYLPVELARMSPYPQVLPQ